MELEKQRIEEKNLSIQRIEPVTVTEIMTNGNRRVERENLIVRQDNQLSNNSESPMGRFLSIDSEQSSEEKEDVHNPSTTNQVKIIKI